MDSYIKSLLTQILEVHAILNELKDKPGDLEIIKKQVEMCDGALKVLCSKIEAYKLYDEDPQRIKNVRTLVITALEEKGLITKIQQVLKNRE